MSRPKSSSAAFDPILVVVALVSAALLLPFAFAPLTREASLAAIDGLDIVRGEPGVANAVSSGEVGASLFAAAVSLVDVEQPAQALAAAFALWHWITAFFLYLVAKKSLAYGGMTAAIVYAATIAVGGTRTVFSPISLAALPIVLALAFAMEERRRARIAFGVFIGVGIAFARETVLVVAAYAYDQFCRNAERETRKRNRFGAWELAGVFAGLFAVAALAGRATDIVEVLRSILATHSRYAFDPVARWMDSALMLAAAVSWFALGTKDSAEASHRRLVAGSTILLWLASCLHPAGDAAAHLPLAGVGALAVAGAYAAMVRTQPFSRAAPRSAAILCSGILLASPLPGAVRAVDFIAPYLRGEDVVTFHGRFFEHDTGFDAAVTVDAAHWIAGNTDGGDAVAIWGSEPGIILHSGRTAMCGFTTIVPLLEGRVDELDRFEKCLKYDRPKVIAVVRNPRHWSGGFPVSDGHGISQPESLRAALRTDYNLAQRLGGFDLFLRNDLKAVHVPLATIFELNVPREP